MSQQKVISLSTIPEAGMHFVFNRKSGELNDAIKDLIGAEPYQFEFDLKPIGNAYELRGEIKTKLPLECSKCGIDFLQPVGTPVNEIFVVEEAMNRKDQTRKTGGFNIDPLATGPFCNYLTSDRLDLGEYLHELIASAEPSRPLGKPDCDKGTCENDPHFDQIDSTSAQKPTTASPFAALKDLQASKTSKKN